MEDRGFRWAMTMLVMLGTIATGVLIGEQASAEIPPFYASMASVPEHRRASDAKIVLADAPKVRIETSDLSYNGSTREAFEDSSY